MNASSNTTVPPQPLSFWERFSFLSGRLIIIFAMVYVPLIFYTMTWRHYAVPKAASFQFLILILAACWAVIAGGRRFIRSAIAAPAAFFFMTVMITSLVAVNLTESWETITFILACIIFVVLIPKFFTRLKDFEVLAYLLGVLCIIVDLYALAQWFNWTTFFQIAEPFGLQKYTHKPVSFMGNENYTAEFLNIASPICFAMIFCHLRRPAELIFFTFVSMMNAIAMLYIDCNASYMGFLFSIPTVLFLLVYYKVIPWITRTGILKMTRGKAEKWFRHLLILSVLLLAVLATLLASTPNKVRTKMTTMASWVDVDGDNRPDGIPPIVFRLQCMDAAIRNIIDVPITGIGAGNFKVMHPRYESQLERKVLGEETLARKVHNDHLYHAAEFGIFGLFGWYWLIATAVYLIFRSFTLLRIQDIATAKESLQEEDQKEVKRSLRPYEREFYFFLQLGILGGIIVAIISCAFGHTFVIQSSAATYFLVTGVCVAAFQVIRRSMEGIPQPKYGTTEESLTRVQRYTRYIPRPFRFLLLFALILPLGAGNQKQLIGEMWLRQGMLAHDSGRYLLMFYCFQNGLKQFPYQMEMYYILGRYYIDAVTEIDNAQYQGEAGQRRLQQMGLANVERDKLLEYGIIALQTDVYMNPNYKWAHNNLGVLYDKLPSFTLSSEAYKRVFQIDREQIFAHYNMGLGYMRQKEFDKAIDSLELALVVDPSKTEIYRFLAQCFMSKQDFKRAMAATDKYLALSLRSRMHAASDKKAKEAIMPLVQSFGPMNIGGNLKVSLENQQLPQTINQPLPQDTPSEVASIEEPELYRLYITIAHESTKKEQQNFELAYDAIQKAEKVISVPPDDAFYWLYGEICNKLGKKDQAIDKWETYLKIKPNDEMTRRSLVNLYLEQQKYKEAASTFAKIINSGNPTWADHISYARIKMMSGTVWGDIFPQIQKAVEKGGDEARKVLQEDTAGFMAKFYMADPRLQELLGPDFKPNIQLPEDQQEQKENLIVPQDNEPEENNN